MIRKDLLQVYQIDEENNLWDAWPIAKLEEHIKFGYAKVIDFDGIVYGFLIYNFVKNKIKIIKMEFKNSTEIPKSLMIQELIGSLKMIAQRKHLRSLEFIVNENREDLISVLREENFIAKEVIRGYFSEVGSDGYLMKYTVPL